MLPRTMKLFLLILLIHLMTRGECTEPDKYSTKYDGIDLEEILASERLLTGYVNCLLDQGPCTPDGKELKRNLPDAIDNDCAKCTERQRDGADQVMHYIIDHRPADWEKLELKYNSDGSYKSKYLEAKKSSSTEKSKEEGAKTDGEDSNEDKD